MSGQVVGQYNFQVAALGNNVLLSATARSRYKIYSIIISPSADITGEIIILLGGSIIYSVQNPKTGAIYGFNLNPNFLQSDENVNLIINLPSATTTDVTVTSVQVFALERD